MCKRHVHNRHFTNFAHNFEEAYIISSQLENMRHSQGEEIVQVLILVHKLGTFTLSDILREYVSPLSLS